MTASPELRYAEVIADQYRRDGYEVVFEPDLSQLPFVLEGYRPDLIARKNGHGVIVEVKRNAKRVSGESLQTIAKEVKRHDGWRFVLHTPEDLPLDDLEAWAVDSADSTDATKRIDRATRLISEGEHESAFLALWILLERSLRERAGKLSLPIERLDVSNILPQLYSLGELTAEQYKVALDFKGIRNRVVHGFPSPELGRSSLQLLKLLQSLMEEWSAIDHDQ